MDDMSADFFAIQKATQLKTIEKEEVSQEAAQDSLQFAGDNALFTNITRSFVDLPRRIVYTREKEKETSPEEVEKRIAEVRRTEETANDFQEKNPELLAKVLIALRDRISVKDSTEEILKKIQEAYPDPSLADDAIDFLIATTDGELAEKLIKVKEQFVKIYGRDIVAGKNIAEQSREFSKQGLGSPTALRDLYRDVTQNPRDAATLFSQLMTSYTFEQLRTVIAFIFHSLGSDLKSKGPSIEKGELANLLKDVKDMQAILGVYRFFKERIKLIFSSFEREGLPRPAKVTFELLAKLFVQLLLERFPSAEKVYQMAMQLGLDDSLAAEMIIFTQMRDSVRLVSPRLFRSDKHKQDIQNLFLEVLEEIENKQDTQEEDE
ncbi:MAG: hypothetical protein FJZ58_03005, partial [Chlamydiae bacterium]|nr:hypothetical protein [Chlamydiota bacterium]